MHVAFSTKKCLLLTPREQQVFNQFKRFCFMPVPLRNVNHWRSSTPLKVQYNKENKRFLTWSCSYSLSLSQIRSGQFFHQCWNEKVEGGLGVKIRVCETKFFRCFHHFCHRFASWPWARCLSAPQISAPLGNRDTHTCSAGIIGKLMCSRSHFTAVKIRIVQPTPGFAAAAEREA